MDTAQRFRDIGDVRYELDQAQAAPDGGVVSVARARPRATWPWVAVSAVAVAIASVAVLNLKPSESRPIGRFAYDLPAGTLFRAIGRPVVAIAPGGQHFVYNTAGGLYLRSMDELDARLIPGTEDLVTTPVFSPDGQEIAFWARGPLVKIAVSGGTPVTLADAVGNPFGMSWESDGTILFGQTDGIWQVPENGGTPVRLIATDAGQQAHGPQLLPGGEWVLYTLTSASGAARWDAAQVVIESRTSTARHVLVEKGRDARYVSTGHLVYALDDELLALPFDLNSLEPGVGPVSVIQGMARAASGATNTGSAFYSFSEDGTLVYVPRTSTVRGLILVTVDRDGTIEPLTDLIRSYWRPRVSPDGSKIAVEVADREQGVTHLWLIDVSTGNGEQFTFEGSLNEMPVWTSDSRTILFRSDRLGNTTNAIFSKSADLSSAAVPVVERDGVVTPTDLSSDGVLVFHENSVETGGDDIWTVDIGAPDLPELFLATSDTERAARYSPDGQWLAYVSDESGELRVYVRPYPATDAGPRQIADEVRFAPVWSPDGTALYTIGAPTAGASPRHLIATTIQTSPSLLTGGSQPLFAGGARGLAANSETSGVMYDVMPDDGRFVWLAVPSVAGATENTRIGPARINIITNWFEELLERVPIP